ncbi:MAG: SdrD B-like domain-containing protein [Acidimicrobiia bacterium]
MSYLIYCFVKSRNFFELLILISFTLGFFLHSIEVYLLRRVRIVSFEKIADKNTCVLIFVGDEDYETVRISFLSIKNLRGKPEVFVFAQDDRKDIESLCSEFNFKYNNSELNSEVKDTRFLVTNGHTILYPDSVLVAERRFAKQISFVELNHSNYSSHALGVRRSRNDLSIDTLLAEKAGSYNVPIYTGGPILADGTIAGLGEILKEILTLNFEKFIAKIISTRSGGTITSHPCCECMSFNEVDHNITTRLSRIYVSRNLRKHPEYVDTAMGIIRRYLGWLYMRFFWVKAVSTCLYAVAFLSVSIRPQIVNQEIFINLVLLLGVSTLGYFSTKIGLDRRGLFERIRDRVLDLEAFLSISFSNRKHKNLLTNHKVKIIPAFLLITFIALILNSFFVKNKNISKLIPINVTIFSLFMTLPLALIIYYSAKRYMSARQRAFARRQVSITGSSSYESMWIIDLTHRGAAYLSDTKLQVGDETPIVFRIPTIHGDSLITVVGKVTYSAARGDKYQIGVAFKELSQEAMDDLITYCSVLYPYHQARNIELEENLSYDNVIKSAGAFKQRDFLTRSVNLISFSVILLLICSSMLKLTNITHDKTSNKSLNSAAIKTEYLSYSNNSIDTNSSNKSDSGAVSVTSSLYEDSNSNGVKDINELGINGAKLKLFDSNDKQINIGKDGVLGTQDDNGDDTESDSSGQISIRLIKPGKYYARIFNIDPSFDISEASKKANKSVKTTDGFRTEIFNASEANNGKINNLDIGFIKKYDVGLSQELTNVPSNGYVPGDSINVKISLRNNSQVSIKSGYQITSKLGKDFDYKSALMTSTGDFTPCGFIKESMKCSSRKDLNPGETKQIEFSVISNISTTSTSLSRMISSSFVKADGDINERNDVQLSNNDISKLIVPVGQSSSIGGQVFFDQNSNGIKDDGEYPISSVSVSLVQFKDINGDGIKDPGETPEIAKDVTDSEGYFGVSKGKTSFQNLTPDASYALVYTNIGNKKVSSGDFVFGNNSEISNLDSKAVVTKWFQLSRNQVSFGNNLPLDNEQRSYSIAIKSKSDNKEDPKLDTGDIRLIRWVDFNENKKIDSQELASEPVNVSKIVESKIDFNLVKDSIAPTYYSLEGNISTGFEFINDSFIRIKSSSNGDFKTSFIPGNNLNKVRLVYKLRGSNINGSYWADFNRNNIKESIEPGVSGLEVVLIDLFGNQVASTFTNKSGNYEFRKVKPARYFVGVKSKSIPNGFVLPLSNKQKVIDGVVGKTDKAVTLVNNSSVTITSLPLVGSASLVGKDEPDTKVFLYSDKLRIGQTSTNKDGKFSFEDINVGDYSLKLEGGRTIQLSLVPGTKHIENTDKNGIDHINPRSLHGDLLLVRYVLLILSLSLFIVIISILIVRRKLFYKTKTI